MNPIPFKHTWFSLPRERGLGEGWSRRFGLEDISYIIHKRNKQEDPTVWHRELYSMSYINNNGKEYKKVCVCVCVYTNIYICISYVINIYKYYIYIYK